MQIKNKETKEDIRARMELLDKESRNNIPKIAMICALILVILAMYQYNSITYHIKSIGKGNPYNCEQCKTLGYACDKHENFKTEDIIKNRTIQYTQSYTKGMTEESSQYAMWGDGYSYNGDCDFCLENMTECYACKHDRLVIEDKINTLINNPVFQTKLCDSCWKEKIPKCDRCIGILADEISSGLSGKTT